MEPIRWRRGPEVVLATGERLVDFSSNDYLGLSTDPRLAEAAAAALERTATGSGAARLVVGDWEEHERLEAELAAFERKEAALLFSSGWQANVGAIAALVGPGDLVVSDALNHASIIDGIRLSRARVEVVPHADPEAVDRALAGPERRKLVVTDSVFSMDGDVAPLRELRAICDRHGALLYVDEAHATGLLGAGGSGACEEAGIEADVVMGTLGKALGCFGAYVAGSAALRAWLVHRCRSFVFTTALPPALCAAARRALQIVREEPERRLRLHENVRRFAAGCERLGLRTRPDGAPAGERRSAVVPVILGDPRAAVAASERLRARGILARAIRPPTVPEGTSRIRFALRADHTAAQIDAALAALGEV